MARTLCLHIGLHRTATTAIQRFLAGNARTLRRQGVLYPTAGRSLDRANWGHHPVAEALREGSAGRTLDAIASEAAGAQSVIISSEELSLMPGPDCLAPIRQRFPAPDWRLRVICYLRPQADYLGSLYAYHVKALGETRPIENFAGSVWFRLDYLNILNLHAEAFGAGSLTIRPFGKNALQADVFTDFLTMSDVADQTRLRRPTAPANPGLTAEGIARMIAADQELAGDEAALAARRRQIASAHSAAPFDTARLAGPELRRQIAERFAADNAEIVRRFGGHLAGTLLTG